MIPPALLRLQTRQPKYFTSRSKEVCLRVSTRLSIAEAI